MVIDWAAISGIADIIQLVKGMRIFSPGEKIILVEETPVINNERYQSVLGKRHRYVREEVLQFHPREMANFYGFEKVAFLEDCENGVDEFPTESIKKLIKTFSIRSEYFQDNQNPIFNSFDIAGLSDGCKYYLEQGFQPYFFCSPVFDDFALTYLVFIKKEKEYCITTKSNSAISLSGGYNISGSPLV
jgi:hypothetical protein